MKTIEIKRFISIVILGGLAFGPSLLRGAVPPAPTGLTPVSGTTFTSTTTSVRLAWNPVPGATSYRVRATDHTDGTVRYAGNDCPDSPRYLCVDSMTSTAITVPVTAGHNYNWWVHAWSAGQIGGAAGGGFSVLNNKAQFVSQSVPATMIAGSTYTVSVTMKNTGTTAWTEAGAYRLGSQNPQDNTRWTGRVKLGSTESVAPGQQKAFTFTVTAPAVAGTHNFQWRMVQEAVEWFGDMSPNVAITVSPPAPTGLTPVSGTIFTSTTTSVRLAWNAVPGATSYWVRADDRTDPEARYSGNTNPNSPIYLYVDNLAGTEITIPVKAGHTYNWWVHAWSAGQIGGAAGGGFSVLNNKAQFVSQSVPATMVAGSTYTVSVTMKNTGATAWTEAGGYRLGSQNPQDNTRWTGRVKLGSTESVAPGQQKAFTFTVTAPAVAGTHNFQWRMVQEAVEWFGDMSPNVAITVSPPAPTGLTPVSGTIFTSTTTSVRLAWNPVPGATSYRVRATDHTDGTVRYAGNDCPDSPRYLCVDSMTSTAITVPVTAGHNYNWWVHAYSSGQVSPAGIGGGFSVLKNDAQFVSQTALGQLVPGESRLVEITFRNTGTTNWTAGGGYMLLSTSTPQNLWGPVRVDLAPGETVAPGAEKTFRVNVKSPMSSGTFPLQWRMIQQRVEWFGAATPADPIEIGWSRTPLDAGFLRSKLGLSTHYVAASTSALPAFAGLAVSHGAPKGGFNVKTVAQQTKQAGASWFLFPLHHQTKLMMAPNETMDRLMGNSNYTAERDVPMEFHAALAKEDPNIRLFLYINLRFDLASLCPPEVRTALTGDNSTALNDALVNNLAAIYEEYSIRYGTKVSGWWVDGVQRTTEWGLSPQRESYFERIATALRAGNSNAVVAFNPGVEMARYTNHADYTAGEQASNNVLPGANSLDNVQWHAWLHLGSNWGEDGTRYDDQTLRDYVNNVRSRGGALLFDVGTVSSSHRGTIDPVQVNQLQRITTNPGLTTASVSVAPPSRGMRVYPIPFSHSRHDGLTFEGVPAGASVRIYTLRGDLIKTLVPVVNGSGPLLWAPVQDEGGGRLSRGVYFYRVQGTETSRQGKFIVLP